MESGHMDVPENSIPMIDAHGSHDYITMGDMFTVMEVRERIDNYDPDPGWYRNSPGMQSTLASKDDISRDGITG